jgi:hypothetical protein
MHRPQNNDAHYAAMLDKLLDADQRTTLEKINKDPLARNTGVIRSDPTKMTKRRMLDKRSEQ